MSNIDLGPATRATAAVVAGVRDDQLGDPTPCPAYTVADLVDHVNGLSSAFTAAARKERLQGGGDPAGDGARLPTDWRTAVPAALTGLAEAWRDPAAFTGTTQAGPVELPAELAAMVALNEVPADDEGGLFGPPVAVPPAAPVLARLAGAAGRRPDWSA